MDHTHWDGTGHAYDRNPLVYLGTLEMILMSTSVAFGVCICVMLIARTRVHFYFASKWCQIFAYLQGKRTEISPQAAVFLCGRMCNADSSIHICSTLVSHDSALFPGSRA